MWVELVVGFFFALRGFSPGSPVFPSPQKPTFSNCNSTRKGRRKTCTFWMCYRQIIIYFINSVVFICHYVRSVKSIQFIDLIIHFLQHSTKNCPNLKIGDRNRMWLMTDNWIQITAFCIAWPAFFFCSDRPRSEAFFKIRAYLCIHFVKHSKGSSLNKMSSYRHESGEESLYITQRMYQRCTCGFPPWINWSFYSKSNNCICSLIAKNYDMKS